MAEDENIFNAMTRMGERVAALEARSGAEIAALKADTAMIRSQGHELNNRLQEVIGLFSAGQNNLGRAQATLEGHMRSCDVRGARLEWLARVIAVAVIGMLGFLIKLHFFPGYL